MKEVKIVNIQEKREQTSNFYLDLSKSIEIIEKANNIFSVSFKDDCENNNFQDKEILNKFEDIKKREMK